ncbi:uncharacterized protein LOC128222353 [Mya arenaria]|uniref:uncharacterized protein LOC128222353 n=1 Tax=Mya arenaria TaxID=6604 RepID=UPI0022E6839A|nr:uncharacterized protein LOC128222353 [Mya arenaria]
MCFINSKKYHQYQKHVKTASFLTYLKCFLWETIWIYSVLKLKRGLGKRKRAGNMGVFDSPEAQNWLRQYLAVFITRKVILPAVKSKAVDLHKDILGRLPAPVCSQDHGIKKGGSKLSCKFHDAFLVEIKSLHTKRPSWENAKTDTWHNDAFSIAKLFMQPSGYAEKNDFDQIDFNGIAAFMVNCTRFATTVQTSSDQARASINKLRHMPDKCSSALTDQATTECIDNLSTLLKDPTLNIGQDAQEALKQLDELKTILPELHEDHWKSIIEDIATKCLQDIHDLCKDEKVSWLTEADKKRADFQSLGDSILSKLGSRGENALGDIKKTLEVSQETIANSIKDGIKIIEKHIVEGKRMIIETTEIGVGKLVKITETGERNIEEKIKREIDAKMKLNEKSGNLTKADLKKELFKLYNKNASTLCIRLDIDKAVGKVYEDPKFTFKEKDKEYDLSEVNYIFRNKDGTMAKTIFVEGEPGSGKSSLCKMIVHEWCETKRDGRKEVKGRELLSQFEFVFYIILREAKKICQVKEMIFENIINRIGFDKRSTEELLDDVLKSNACLLLLDGLDEWMHPETCPDDERIPHVKTKWENCTILITTRPYKMAELKISQSQIGKHVMLKGVSNPERLVEKVVSSLNEMYDIGRSQGPKSSRLPLNHEICIKEIRDKELLHFSECPIVLVHIVWDWYKGKLLVDMKQSELYSTLLHERWLESCGKRNPDDGSIYRNMINALSKIAFEKLFAKDEHNSIVFEIDEEKYTKFDRQKSASLESGILFRTNVPGDSPQYYFLHKTFQEYLAALYLSEHIAKGCLYIKDKYKHTTNDSGISLYQVFLFLCGLNKKAAKKLSKIMNKLFTNFCDRNCYSWRGSRMLQDKILQGRMELERSDNSGRKLCLQHIYIEEFDESPREREKANVLKQYITTNPSSIISLHIDNENTKDALHLGKRSDNKVLDLRKFKGLKYLHVNNTTFKDVTGLNLKHLVECRIRFETPQQAPRLTSSFYKSDNKCLKRMKTLELSNLTDLNWLQEGSERDGILDMRRLANLQHLSKLVLENLSYSDVVNLHKLRLHKLTVTFNELQQARQLISTLSAHGTCQVGYGDDDRPAS